MPKPKPGETRENYVSRCIPIVLDEGTAEDQEQAAAICNSMWRSAKKEAAPHDRLLDLVRARTSKQTEFNYGILTADRYVKRFLDEIGVQGCYRHMCRTKGEWASFEDVMQKAADTLSYINADMEVKAKEVELPAKIERPKNTLMVFRHVLTSSVKDRDGDILRTKGAKPDPKMLLLWQHVHTLPIGKMLAVANHTKDELQLYSCIVDMNELCHDAAVMVDNGMGRFSHGFRALDFLEIKEGRDSAGGFDVKEFEILEESLVSVPANPDAETEEVLLSLVEGGKLTSGLMKDYGQAIRDRRPLSLPVKLDLKLTVNGQEVKSDENERRDQEGSGREKRTGSPEKAETVSDEGREEEKSSEDAEVKGKKFWVTIKQMEEVCSTCAEKMKELGLKKLDLYHLKQMPNRLLHALYAKFPEPGFFTACSTHTFGGAIDDIDAFCAWLHKECLGIWPGEGKGKSKQLIDDSASGGINAVPPEHDQSTGEGKNMVCPECDYVGPGKGGKCPECGAKLMPRKDFVMEKLGRVLSKSNEGKIREAIDDLGDASKMDGVPRGCKALINQAKRGLGDVVASLGGDGDGAEKTEEEIDVKRALAVVLAKGGTKELKVMESILTAIEKGRRDDEVVRQYEGLFSST